MSAGLDTGFFLRLLQGRAEALEVWDAIIRRRSEGVVSCVTLYELRRLGLRGAVSADAMDILVQELPHLCAVVWLDDAELLERAARIAHGNALSMADAIILASLIRAGADAVYTTDRDLARYGAGPEIVLLR